MVSFGKLLRQRIVSSGYTIYRAANKAGINRTTLQKVLSDERSATKELLEQLLPVLKLSPDEEAEIRSCFEMTQTGEVLYAQRQYIKRLLESMSCLDKTFYMENSQTVYNGFSDYLQLEDEGFTEGTHNVERLIFTMIHLECRKKHPAILFKLPGSASMLNRLFLYGLSNCKTEQGLTLRHITPMTKNPENSNSPLANLEALANILPFSMAQNFDYEASYYYDVESTSLPYYTAFPHYIVFTDAVVFLSADSSAAYYSRNKTSLEYFRNLFDASRKRSTPLITACTNVMDILSYMTEMDKTPRSLFTIEYQPCLAAYMTESMIQKYARPELPNKENLVQATLYRIKQLQTMNEHSCIFNKSGLTDFVLHSTISDFPPCYILPLEVSDRIKILESLYQDCSDDKQLIRVVNPIAFSLPEHLSCSIRSDYSVDFSGFDTTGKYFSYVHISEPTILEAFEDFFQYLLDSELIGTKEETLAEIRRGISILRYP